MEEAGGGLAAFGGVTIINFGGRPPSDGGKLEDTDTREPTVSTPL